MITTLPPYKLHIEYQLWIAELNFDIELIKIFEGHLAFITSHNTSKKLLAHIEQFQNQFIRQREVIDELKHDLNISEKQLASFVRDMATVGYENERLDNHSGLRDRFLRFRDLFEELKTRFRHFETEHL
ncbi:MAG: hypothetical protein ACHQF0_06665 [Chitinophagales bacterium]